MSAWRKLGIKLEIESSEDDMCIARELCEKLSETAKEFCKEHHVLTYIIGNRVVSTKEHLETKWRKGDIEKQINLTICKAVTIQNERSVVMIYIGCTPFNEDAIMPSEIHLVADRICKVLNNV